MGYTLADLHKRTLLNLFARLCQLVCALVVCVYYGRVVNKAVKNNVYGDPKWLFAVTVGALSGLTALIYMVWSLVLEFRAIALLFAWDAILVIAWAACSGIFGKMYLSENPEMDDGIQKMKVAAYFNIVNMLLWLLSAGYCGWVVFIADRSLLLEGRKKDSPGGVEMGEKESRESTRRR